jgi:hypothetical protein
VVPERDRDAETVRRRDRRGDFTFDDGELVQSSRVRVAALREFDDGTRFSVPSSGNAIAAHRPRVISWMIASVS